MSKFLMYWCTKYSGTKQNQAQNKNRFWQSDYILIFQSFNTLLVLSYFVHSEDIVNFSQANRIFRLISNIEEMLTPKQSTTLHQHLD